MGDDPLLPGHTVLVQGSGGVSVFALQFAKMAGATVIATSSLDKKLERLKALGADHTINYQSTPDWGVAARKLTGGQGVDHVVEIGGAGTLPQSIAACAMGGHIVLIGVLAGVSGEVPTARLMASQIRLQGLMVGKPRAATGDDSCRRSAWHAPADRQHVCAGIAGRRFPASVLGSTLRQDLLGFLGASCTVFAVPRGMTMNTFMHVRFEQSAVGHGEDQDVWQYDQWRAALPTLRGTSNT